MLLLLATSCLLAADRAPSSSCLLQPNASDAVAAALASVDCLQLTLDPKLSSSDASALGSAAAKLWLEVAQLRRPTEEDHLALAIAAGAAAANFMMLASMRIADAEHAPLSAKAIAAAAAAAGEAVDEHEFKGRVAAGMAGSMAAAGELFNSLSSHATTIADIFNAERHQTGSAEEPMLAADRAIASYPDGGTAALQTVVRGVALAAEGGLGGNSGGQMGGQRASLLNTVVYQSARALLASLEQSPREWASLCAVSEEGGGEGYKDHIVRRQRGVDKPGPHRRELTETRRAAA